MARLEPVVADIWVVSEPTRIVGMPLSTNMTVVRLPSGELLLHSPVPCTDALRRQIASLGPVRHLYAPNTFHHLWLADWAHACPHARVHAPATLAAKRPGLRIDRFHDEAREPAFAGVLEEHHVDGFRMEETVLFHRPSHALIVADLVHNIGRPAHPWTRAYAGTMGFYGRIAVSRVIRWAAFADRSAARQSLCAILELPFEHLLVGHGAPIIGSGRQALRDAYTWLDPGAKVTPRQLPMRGTCG